MSDQERQEKDLQHIITANTTLEDKSQIESFALDILLWHMKEFEYFFKQRYLSDGMIYALASKPLSKNQKEIDKRIIESINLFNDDTKDQSVIIKGKNIPINDIEYLLNRSCDRCNGRGEIKLHNKYLTCNVCNGTGNN